MTSHFVIERDPTTILRFLSDIQREADSEREALGFLPHSAYTDQILARKVLLLLAANNVESPYAGHLLFGGIFPRLRVYQIVIPTRFRGKGGGTQLIRGLVSQAESEGYLSISAHVAADLKAANDFYERNGFIALGSRPGGQSRGRTLILRVREVESPSLLALMSPTRPVIQLSAMRSKSNPPLYAIDLNVYFDVIKDRPRKHEAETLFGAALGHEIRIVVTSEFAAELERTSKGHKDDPVLSLAQNLPCLPRVAPERLKSLSVAVESMLFVHRDSTKPLSARNKSDVAQLANAIAAGATGYITSDAKLLECRETLLSQFNMDVISLTECVEALRPFATSRTSLLAVESGLQIECCSDVGELLSWLPESTLSPQQLSTMSQFQTGNVQCRMIRDHGSCIGASLVGATFDAPHHLYVWVDEYHPLASTISDYLIGEACKLVSRDRIARVELVDDPLQPITRRIALAHGFGSHGNDRMLQKIAVGRAIAAADWKLLVSCLQELAELQLPASVPDFGSTESRVVIRTKGGQEVDCTLLELETLLSPLVLALPGRTSVLVPIEKQYAKDLIGSDSQLSFLSAPEAGFLRTRTYFNSVRTSRVMAPGAALVFYESKRSGGSGAAVAIARIVDVTQVPVGCVPEDLRRGGVVRKVGSLTASDRILATTFDNLVAFEQPVTLEHLREMRCVGPSNLRTATPLEPHLLASIVSVATRRNA